MGLFGFFSARKIQEDPNVIRLLQRLEQNNTQFQVEIESTLLRFGTMLLNRGGGVVLARPRAISNHLKKGSFIRFNNPFSQNEVVRMEILVPAFNLTNGTPALICKRPDKILALLQQRSNNRYNTSRFSNLKLYIPGNNFLCRIVDLSYTGCKAIIPSENFAQDFPLNEPLSGCELKLGSKVSIPLHAVTPKSHHRNAIGFEFTTVADHLSSNYLSHLITSLERKEAYLLKAERLR